MTNCRPKANGLSISFTDLNVTMSVGIWLSDVNRVIKNKTIKKGTNLLQLFSHTPDWAFSFVNSKWVTFENLLFSIKSFNIHEHEVYEFLKLLNIKILIIYF